jgi:hypothetical protein
LDCSLTEFTLRESQFFIWGCSRSDTITKQITVYPKIEKHFLGEDINWCENIDTFVIIQAPLGMHCYEWSTGETTPEIETDSAGVYWVKITTPNFCILFVTVIVSIDTLPSIEKNFLGEDKNWCENIDTVFTFAAPTGMMSYKWSTTDTAKEIIVNTQGIYWITLTAYNNCIISDTIALSNYPAPEIPIIYKENDTLKTSNTAIEYQWYKNDNPTGFNQPFLYIEDSGVYHLQINDSNGYTAMSDTIQIHLADTNINIKEYDVNQLNRVLIFPNPFPNQIIIENKSDNQIEIIMYDQNGKVIERQSIKEANSNINTSKLSNGLYFVKVTNKQGHFKIYKLIKQNE